MSGLRAKKKSSAQIQSEGAASGGGGKGGGLIKGVIMGAIGVPSLGAAVGAEGAATALPSEAASAVESTGTFDAATGEGITGASTVKVDPSTGEGISALTPTTGSTNYADKISNIYSVSGKKPSWFQNILTDGQAGEQYRQRAYAAELNKAGAQSALIQMEAANQLAIDRQLNPALNKLESDKFREQEGFKAFMDNFRKANLMVDASNPKTLAGVSGRLGEKSLIAAEKNIEAAPQVTQKQIEKDQASIAASEASTRASDQAMRIAEENANRAREEAAILRTPEALKLQADYQRASALRGISDTKRITLGKGDTNMPFDLLGDGSFIGTTYREEIDPLGRKTQVPGGSAISVGSTEVPLARVRAIRAAVEAGKREAAAMGQATGAESALTQPVVGNANAPVPVAALTASSLVPRSTQPTGGNFFTGWNYGQNNAQPVVPPTEAQYMPGGSPPALPTPRGNQTLADKIEEWKQSVLLPKIEAMKNRPFIRIGPPSNY